MFSMPATASTLLKVYAKPSSTAGISIWDKSIVELILSLSCLVLLGSATYFEGRLAAFEVMGTLAQLKATAREDIHSRDGLVFRYTQPTGNLR